MKFASSYLPAALAATLVTLSAPARADVRPDFNQDAKPILRMQPELLHYVKTNFDVQETGYAKVPGDDNHAPPPPYIFRARTRGADGPYNITLLIQPGPPGHILLVKPDATGPGAPPPPVEQQPPPPAPANNDNPAPQPAPAQAAPPASSIPSGPTSATPSGPIKLDSSSSSLAPPPDPAPAH
jgi:hypothetical protein